MLKRLLIAVVAVGYPNEGIRVRVSLDAVMVSIVSRPVTADLCNTIEQFQVEHCTFFVKVEVFDGIIMGMTLTGAGFGDMTAIFGPVCHHTAHVIIFYRFGIALTTAPRPALSL
ncbi:MAG: hypothetical protein MUF38_17725 [Anaerolineae bacterium]|nr:hypothetical protein [Anaerolineae bacterium]